jgi:uncharacterized protein YjbJ (UPF0337 family)
VGGRFAVPYFIDGPCESAVLFSSVTEMPEFMRRRIEMKESTTDKIKGKVHEVKGAVKEKIGKATNDRDLEAEGQDENVGGKIQKTVGKVEKAAGV